MTLTSNATPSEVGQHVLNQFRGTEEYYVIEPQVEAWLHGASEMNETLDQIQSDLEDLQGRVALLETTTGEKDDS